jgi:hypothetical protein
MIVLFMVTWYHACGDSVGSVESATIGLLIRTDDLSWIVSLTTYRTTRRIPTTGKCATVSKGQRHGTRGKTARPQTTQNILQDHLHMSKQHVMSCHVMVVSKLDNNNKPIPSHSPAF